MTHTSDKTAVYLEIGQKRTFAGAIDWAGWCRSGRDERSALQTLLDYGPRYAAVLRTAQLGFEVPIELSALTVVERLQGNATTDFGAPDIPPSADAGPVGQTEIERFQALLEACWNALDVAGKKATGKELRRGPRGGGRNLDQIIQHVLGAEAAYLNRLSWKLQTGKTADSSEALSQTREAVLEALAAASHGGLPERGPRGGSRWTPRYFVRRTAWHILDHAWEIEDRIV